MRSEIKSVFTLIILVFSILISGCSTEDSVDIQPAQEVVNDPQDETESSALPPDAKVDDEIKVNELIVKKACEDYATALPRTDIRYPDDIISTEDAKRFFTNWARASRIEPDLEYAELYMNLYVQILESVPYPDENWTEDLRESGYVPLSEVEAKIDFLMTNGVQANEFSRVVCAEYDIFIDSPAGLN